MTGSESGSFSSARPFFPATPSQNLSTPSTHTCTQEYRALSAELAAKEALLADAVTQTAAWRGRAADLVAAHDAADKLSGGNGGV